MLVYPAASELNTQPVHKIPFINALSLPDAFHLKFLAFSRPITDGRGCRSVVFHLPILFQLISLAARQTHCVSSHSLLLLYFMFFFRLSSLAERHSVLAVLPAIILLPRKLTEMSRDRPCLVLHHDRFAHLFVRYFYLDITLSFFPFCLWHVYVYLYVLYLVG